MQSMTKKALIELAQSKGLKVSNNLPKWQIIATIEAHDRYIKVNSLMANRYN